MAHLQSWAKAPSRHACKLQPREQSLAPVRLTHWPLALLHTLPSQDGKLSQGSTPPVAGSCGWLSHHAPSCQPKPHQCTPGRQGAPSRHLHSGHANLVKPQSEESKERAAAITSRPANPYHPELSKPPVSSRPPECPVGGQASAW